MNVKEKTASKLLRKQLVPATMNCKHEDSNHVAEFWQKFNDAFKKVNTTQRKFWPYTWVTDMASAIFNNLATFIWKKFFQGLKDASFILKNQSSEYPVPNHKRETTSKALLKIC